ncbi:uncharacterized protein PGTG_21219 [Puccinia graminis f. sp. tritici CRL 75-36-700-3]|uniref:Uncharacterized protein n=1 Tax=Puccinia graminis f. sp. tritici (strain CRL 75-36-700-3 / race SCCL) TaxID=418459 RepID=H6QQP2_PUCGT|nr:uncharacterized protein PGTG_21219 [Puccinia graminis f. sp. tritici CRL 75-36-700-3]EHS62756.1 hypothetical protein PGTG_21219 [Puccinia graminis f. sp. tritici CRL 75-36-700-3]
MQNGRIVGRENGRSALTVARRSYTVGFVHQQTEYIKEASRAGHFLQLTPASLNPPNTKKNKKTEETERHCSMKPPSKPILLAVLLSTPAKHVRSFTCGNREQPVGGCAQETKDSQCGSSSRRPCPATSLTIAASLRPRPRRSRHPQNVHGLLVANHKLIADSAGILWYCVEDGRPTRLRFARHFLLSPQLHPAHHSCPLTTTCTQSA